MPEIEDKTCVTAETTIASPDCFKLKIGLNITGSTGLLGSGATAGTVTYALGLCSDVVTFSDICCFNNMSSIVLALPLSFVQDCHRYTLVDIPLGPQLVPIVVDTTVPSGGTGSPIDIQVANGYLYVIIGSDRFDVEVCTDDDEGCSRCVVTITFTLFNFFLRRSINYCNCACVCKPIVWYFGSDPDPFLAAPVLT